MSASDSMDIDKRRRFLAELPLLRELSEAEIEALAQLFQEQSHTPDEPIVREGAPFGALCIVYRGQVAVEKHDLGVSMGQSLLSQLPVGTLFGEMSFLDGESASATVRATEPTTILRLERSRLAELGEPLASRLRERLLALTARSAVERMRSMGNALAATRRAWKDESRRRQDLARFLVVVVVLFGLGNLVQRLITPDLSPWLHMGYSWGVLLLIVGLCALFIGRQHASLVDFGLTGRGAGRSALEGLALGGVLVVVALSVRAQVRLPGEPLLLWGSLAKYSATQLAVFLIAYPFHCLLQEFVARGVIQNSISRLAGDGHPHAGALITALMFAIFHLYVSLGFAALTFVASLAFGMLYLRHKNLAGVTLTHYGVGMGSIFLGLN